MNKFDKGCTSIVPKGNGPMILKGGILKGTVNGKIIAVFAFTVACTGAVSGWNNGLGEGVLCAAEIVTDAGETSSELARSI